MNSERDTYAFNTPEGRLEEIEWDDIWRQDADCVMKKRILVIGDSISRGYRHFLINKVGKEYAVDSVATSKAADNERLIDLLDYMKMQNYEYVAVQFNNGLHGWHLDDAGYRRGYMNILEHIKNIYPQAKLYIALTTPVRSTGNLNEFAERNTAVIRRNDTAKVVADKMNAEVIDLYHIVEQSSHLYRPDGVHFLEKGYELLADECAKKYVRGE